MIGNASGKKKIRLVDTGQYHEKVFRTSVTMLKTSRNAASAASAASEGRDIHSQRPAGCQRAQSDKQKRSNIDV